MGKKLQLDSGAIGPVATGAEASEASTDPPAAAGAAASAPGDGLGSAAELAGYPGLEPELELGPIPEEASTVL